ncbi:MAG: hypothetical protein ACRDRJ_43885 [Streptosporangiaceae bacterium]
MTERHAAAARSARDGESGPPERVFSAPGVSAEGNSNPADWHVMFATGFDLSVRIRDVAGQLDAELGQMGI